MISTTLDANGKDHSKFPPIDAGNASIVRVRNCFTKRTRNEIEKVFDIMIGMYKYEFASIHVYLTAYL